MHKVIRILIIDDDSSVRAMISAALSDEGYEVSEAADGMEGMKSYQNSPTDLVITDLVMPGKEGLETIIELRREFPEVKVIAISGGTRYGSDTNLRAAERLGARQILSKPFKIPALLKAVREALSSS